ncbi:MAG: glycosyltransferase [Candidatus Pacearchaeota archaeon]
MKTSFISTVFNEESNIERFLKSILKQTKKPDEIIIVDGGSKDKTYEILKKYAKKNKKLRVFQEKGVNIAKGRNIAISKAKGDILIASDAGCVIDKNWVKDTLRYFPKADVVVGNYKAITKNNFEFFQSFIAFKHVNKNIPSRMSSRNIAFKKKCWKEVEGYPEDFLTGEDTRFNIKLIKKGYKIEQNPKPYVAWEMRPTLKKFAKQFYLYGKGDRIQKNLLKKRMKKNLLMVFGFWIYLVVFLIMGLVKPTISLWMVLVPLAILVLYSFKFLIKTGKISALFWIPIIMITKRVSYILGVTFK